MYGIFTNICPKNHPNVSYGIGPAQTFGDSTVKIPVLKIGRDSLAGRCTKESAYHWRCGWKKGCDSYIVKAPTWPCFPVGTIWENFYKLFILWFQMIQKGRQDCRLSVWNFCRILIVYRFMHLSFWNSIAILSQISRMSQMSPESDLETRLGEEGSPRKPKDFSSNQLYCQSGGSINFISKNLEDEIGWVSPRGLSNSHGYD